MTQLCRNSPLFPPLHPRPGAASRLAPTDPQLWPTVPSLLPSRAASGQLSRATPGLTQAGWARSARGARSGRGRAHRAATSAAVMSWKTVSTSARRHARLSGFAERRGGPPTKGTRLQPQSQRLGPSLQLALQEPSPGGEPSTSRDPSESDSPYISQDRPSEHKQTNSRIRSHDFNRLSQ